MKTPAKIFEELLVYADISKVNPLLGEVSKLLEAYSTAILNSDS